MAKKGALNRRTLAWLKEVQHNVAEAESLCDAKTGKCGQLDFKAATRVAEDIGEQYRGFNQNECQDLSNTLMDMEDSQRRGHVLLKDFYKPGLHNSWNFTEKEDYLRALGTLDETDPSNPRVIIPNYVYSRPNCLATSEIYVVCCKNTCEDMLAKLEIEIAAPTATPEQISNVLGADPGLASVSLSDLASMYGGMIPIHGRAFAQWMHEAYPRKCPRPLPEGLSHIHDPEDWMTETGRDSTIALEAEKLKQERTCGPDGKGCNGIEAMGGSSSTPELPQDPATEEQDNQGTPFPWIRSVVIFCFMVYLALIRSSSKDGKSNWTQLSSTVTSCLSHINAPSKSDTLTVPDGNWV